VDSSDRRGGAKPRRGCPTQRSAWAAGRRQNRPLSADMRANRTRGRRALARRIEGVWGYSGGGRGGAVYAAGSSPATRRPFAAGAFLLRRGRGGWLNSLGLSRLDPGAHERDGLSRPIRLVLLLGVQRVPPSAHRQKPIGRGRPSLERYPRAQDFTPVRDRAEPQRTSCVRSPRGHPREVDTALVTAPGRQGSPELLRSAHANSPTRRARVPGSERSRSRLAGRAPTPRAGGIDSNDYLKLYGWAGRLRRPGASHHR